ncbi:hypothetical protein ABC502_00635 [Alkalimonas sp. NCh-2]|uniref:hypothetical protein n=1 Tax=Alkalimonas sp. NCh-2 TaxID=3144846 RepID=UPI0031F69872
MITSTTTPIANANDVPGNVGGYPVSEWIAPNTETTEQGGLSSNTGTSVHEGHWSDSIYFSKSGDTWRNPVTNQIEPLPEGTKIHKDHIFPKNEIKKLPGFDLLTPDEKRLVLSDPDNYQLMPASPNCSKGCTVEGTDRSWNPSEKVVPGGLNPDYRNWLKDKQEESQERLQTIIDKLLNGG